MPKPLKRHEALKPISREHHHGLLLCWKIRTGIDKGIDESRIKKYVDYFYKTYLVPHFRMEEAYIFPVLGDDHKLIIQAVSQHRRLESLFNAKSNLKESFNSIQLELDAHIRFEERVLFGEIQKVATVTELKLIEDKHELVVPSVGWADEFWV